MWALGIKLALSGLLTSTITHWTISSTQRLKFPATSSGCTHMHKQTIADVEQVTSLFTKHLNRIWLPFFVVSWELRLARGRRTGRILFTAMSTKPSEENMQHHYRWVTTSLYFTIRPRLLPCGGFRHFTIVAKKRQVHGHHAYPNLCAFPLLECPSPPSSQPFFSSLIFQLTWLGWVTRYSVYSFLPKPLPNVTHCCVFSVFISVGVS